MALSGMAGVIVEHRKGASIDDAMQAIAALGLNVNVTGWIPSAENMPSGTAQRPGDVVTSMSGQTIEVINTDAEGRLVLADLLVFAKRFNPAIAIDAADAEALAAAGDGDDLGAACRRVEFGTQAQQAFLEQFEDAPE